MLWTICLQRAYRYNRFDVVTQLRAKRRAVLAFTKSPRNSVPTAVRVDRSLRRHAKAVRLGVRVYVSRNRHGNLCGRSCDPKRHAIFRQLRAASREARRAVDELKKTSRQEIVFHLKGRSSIAPEFARIDRANRRFVSFALGVAVFILAMLALSSLSGCVPKNRGINDGGDRFVAEEVEQTNRQRDVSADSAIVKAVADLTQENAALSVKIDKLATDVKVVSSKTIGGNYNSTWIVALLIGVLAIVVATPVVIILAYIFSKRLPKIRQFVYGKNNPLCREPDQKDANDG